MNKVLKEKDFKRKFPIKLVKHNSEWTSWYEDKKTNLLDKLKKYKVTLYHIGSYSNSKYLFKGYNRYNFRNLQK